MLESRAYFVGETFSHCSEITRSVDGGCVRYLPLGLLLSEDAVPVVLVGTGDRLLF